MKDTKMNWETYILKIWIINAHTQHAMLFFFVWITNELEDQEFILFILSSCIQYTLCLTYVFFFFVTYPHVSIWSSRYYHSPKFSLIMRFSYIRVGRGGYLFEHIKSWWCFQLSQYQFLSQIYCWSITLKCVLVHTLKCVYNKCENVW